MFTGHYSWKGTATGIGDAGRSCAVLSRGFQRTANKGSLFWRMVDLGNAADRGLKMPGGSTTYAFFLQSPPSMCKGPVDVFVFCRVKPGPEAVSLPVVTEIVGSRCGSDCKGQLDCVHASAALQVLLNLDRPEAFEELKSCTSEVCRWNQCKGKGVDVNYVNQPVWKLPFTQGDRARNYADKPAHPTMATKATRRLETFSVVGPAMEKLMLESRETPEWAAAREAFLKGVRGAEGEKSAFEVMYGVKE